MNATQIIGKTFGYSGIDDNMVYVVIVESLEPAGEKVESDIYMGKQILIFPNGESLSQDWCCVKGRVERKVESGEYKFLR